MTAPLPLRRDATGDAVRDLQRRLTRAGHPCGADRPGIYGPGTEGAVRAFQERRGLRGDGVCGTQTWSSLVEAGLALGDRLLYLRAPMLRGDDVVELQTLLGGLGFDAGKVDGILGSRTAEAVAEFQRNAGLTTDGICGPETIAALRRVASRADQDGPSSTVASLREVEGLRAAPRHVAGLRVAVAEGGGLGALADALARALSEAGATVSVLGHPDESSRAAAANAFEAGAFIALAVRDEPGATCSFYAHEPFESVGGRRLAELVGDALGGAGLDVDRPRGMRLPLLRETRMPAVVVEVGPPAVAVARAPAIVAAVAEAVARWVAAPVDH
jgi:N-acetylmuramoyl-L-alanine amidase